MNSSSIIDLQSQILALKEQNEELKSYLKKTTISKNRYKELFDKSLEGNVIFDNDANIVESNEAFAKMHGYTVDEISKLNLRDLNTPAEKNLMKSRMEKLQNGESLHFEVEHFHRDGTIIVLDVVASYINDNKNSYYISSHRDITYKKEAASAINENESNLKAIIENSLDSIWSIDNNYNINYVNDVFANAFESSFGVKLTKGVNLLASLPEPLQPIWKERYDKGLSGQQFVFVDKVQINNGSFLHIEVSMNPILVKGKVVGISLFGRDITEKKNTEAELLRLNNQKSLILNSVSEGIIGVNLKGKHTFFNKAALKMLGYSKAEFEGKYSHQLWHHHNADGSELLKDNCGINKTLQTGEKYSSENEVFYKKDGTFFPVEYVSSPIFEAGKLTGAVVSFKDISLRKKSNAQINKLFQAVEQSPVSVLISDINGDIEYVNPKFTEITGYSKEEVLGKNRIKLKSGGTSDPEHKEMIDTIKSGNDWKGVFNAKKKNGEHYWESVSVSLIKDKAGNITNYLTIVEDISDKKLASEALKNSEEKFRDMANLLPQLLVEINLRGEITYVNHQAWNMFGYTEDELIGKSSLVAHVPEERDLIVESIKLKYAGKDFINREFKMLRKDGSVFPALIFSSVIYTNGKKAGIRAIVIDISDQKKVEEELIIAKEKAEESENRLTTFIDSIPDIVCYKNGKGEWLLANDADLELFDLKGVDYYGKTDLELAEYTNKIYQDAFKSCALSDEDAWKKREISNGIEVIPTIDGKTKIYDVFKIPIFHTNGKRKALAVIGRDITKLYETQERLRIAKERAEESDRLKSAFLANMSHEIRTPMNGILGFANLLRNPKLNGEQQRDFIDIIEKAGERMLNIINDIVNISKIESGLMELNIEESNINEQLEYIYTFFKPQIEEKGMAFNLNKPANSKEIIIKTDREKVFAVFTNLVKNAVKYCDKGSIEIGYSIKNKFLKFYVKDTGIGIPKDRQSAVFERFIQADISDKMAKQGAGLGLSISKAYIEMLGGEIWLESQEEDLSSGIKSGSTFYFTLPYDKKVVEEETSLIEDFKPKANINKKLKILIAEDDHTSQMLISIAVKSFSKEILTVESGEKTVEICKNNPDIDLILMDIQMPNLNGYEATKQIREFNKDVIIIAQTAFALEGDREKVLAAGCNDYISKPINIDKLKTIISKYL